MNELQIQYFFAVADCGGYTQAAQDLFVSQPAISKQIAALEEELGVTLFERGKQTRLTESGRLFYDCFQRMLGGTQLYYQPGPPSRAGSGAQSASEHPAGLFH